MRILRRAWTGLWSFADEGSSSRAMIPVRGGCRLGSGNRLVQSGPWSPFGRILSKCGCQRSQYEVRANKCVAHLRHDSSYSPGPDTTLTSPGSSSNERLTRHTAADSSPGSHSGDHQVKKMRIRMKSSYLRQHRLHLRPENTQAP